MFTFSLILCFSINTFTLGDILDSVRLIFYYGPTLKDHEAFMLDNVTPLLSHPKFVHKNTSCYFPGYTNTQDDFSIHLLVDSYLKGNEFNFLVVDYAALVNGSYIEAQQNMQKFVPKFTKSILDLISAGLDIDSFSLVGHSLGGVTIGMVGENIQNMSNGNIIIPRISPLDPSNPKAHDVFILPPVRKTNARFVDVIHSSAGETGTSAHSGHADFWPNGGKPIQPGCPTDPNTNTKCSHSKAYAYWAQSVAKINSTQLLAYRADNYEEFSERQNYLKTQQAIPMGIYCPQSAFGDYYLNLTSTYGEKDHPNGIPK